MIYPDRWHALVLMLVLTVTASDIEACQEPPSRMLLTRFNLKGDIISTINSKSSEWTVEPTDGDLGLQDNFEMKRDGDLWNLVVVKAIPTMPKKGRKPPSISLKLSCFDHETVSSTDYVIRVMVLSENQFERVQITLPENTTVGSVIYEEEKKSAQSFKWFMQGVAGMYFQTDTGSGSVSLKKGLDFEAGPLVMWFKAIFTPAPRSFKIRSFRIQVNNSNDNAPTFLDNGECNVNEGCRVNSYQFTINEEGYLESGRRPRLFAGDVDGDRVTFSITNSKRIEEVFTIDATNGELRTHGPFQEFHFVLRVQASDGVHKSSVLVTIEVIKDRDETTSTAPSSTPEGEERNDALPISGNDWEDPFLAFFTNELMPSVFDDSNGKDSEEEKDVSIPGADIIQTGNQEEHIGLYRGIRTHDDESVSDLTVKEPVAGTKNESGDGGEKINGPNDTKSKEPINEHSIGNGSRTEGRREGDQTDGEDDIQDESNENILKDKIPNPPKTTRITSKEISPPPPSSSSDKRPNLADLYPDILSESQVDPKEERLSFLQFLDLVTKIKERKDRGTADQHDLQVFKSVSEMCHNLSKIHEQGVLLPLHKMDGSKLTIEQATEACQVLGLQAKGGQPGTKKLSKTDEKFPVPIDDEDPKNVQLRSESKGARLGASRHWLGKYVLVALSLFAALLNP